MARNTKVPVQNAESSVLFLQQEHAKTLEGLYTEIGKLQKKCGELTFQIAMNSTCVSSDEENFHERCLKAEKELNSKSSEVNEVKKLLENNRKHNNLLERNFRRSEETFDETVRNKDKKIASLTAELDAKAGNIAYLTKQLHNSKVAYAELAERLVTSMTICDRNIISPAPPVERPPLSGNRRRFVRKTATDTTEIEMLGNGLNPASSRMFVNINAAKSNNGFPSRPNRTRTPTKNTQNARSYTESRTMPEDYTEFLKTGLRPEPRVVYKPVPNPLPPILNDSKQTYKKVHHSRGKDAGVLDEIVVSPLNSPDKNWRQGSNQYDSVS